MNNDILLWQEKGKWCGVKYIDIVNTCPPFYEFQVKDDYIERETLEEVLEELNKGTKNEETKKEN